MDASVLPTRPSRSRRRRRGPRRRRLGGTAAAGVAAALAWAALVEPRTLRRRCQTLTLPRWPAALDGFRVGVLADLHAGAPPVDALRVDRVAKALRSLRPDLILLAGDLVDADTPLGGGMPPEAVADRLRVLRARFGVVGVLGNHDRALGGERVRTALESAGVCMLQDDAARIELDGAPLWVVGFSDAASQAPVVEGTLRRVPDGEPILALTHSPDVFPCIPDIVALTVAGHTHAGQVNLPLIRRLVIPSRFGERYAEGHIEENGRHLFVDRGVGASTLPLRFRAPPQVTLLELRAGASVTGESERGRAMVG